MGICPAQPPGNEGSCRLELFDAPVDVRKLGIQGPLRGGTEHGVLLRQAGGKPLDLLSGEPDGKEGPSAPSTGDILLVVVAVAVRQASNRDQTGIRVEAHLACGEASRLGKLSDSHSAPSPRRHDLTFTLVSMFTVEDMRRMSALSFAVMFLVATDTFLVAPLLPALTARFGSSPTVAGWMVSAYAVGYCITAVFAGPVSDRFDRKRMLVTGMVVFSVATFACGMAWSFPSMLALRFLTGVAAAIGSPQVWAAIPQLVPREKIVSAMAAPTAGLTIAQLAGVPAGSFLSVRSTSDPFFAVGIVAAIVTLAVVRWFPSVPPHAAPARLIAQYATLWRTRHANGRFTAYLAFQIGNFAVLSFAATWFAHDFHLDQAGIGTAMIVLGAGNTLGAVLGPRIVRRLGQGRSLLLALACYLVGYAALPLSSGIVTAAGLLTATFFIGGMIFPVFQTLLQSLTTTARGTVSALTNVLMYAGSTIAGILGGPLLAILPGFWGICLLALAAMALSLAFWAGSDSISVHTRRPAG